jgi:site-specific recombinase XerD
MYATTVLVMSAKPVSHIPQSPRLLDQLREVLRYKHYRLRTEEAYLYWVKFFVRWHGRDGQVRHPRELGAAELAQFLSMLTTRRNVSVSTHNQALSALLFLYRDVLGVQLPWLDEVQRPTRPRRIPSALTVAEVAALLGAMTGVERLLVKLLYGTGMRLNEGLRLRGKTHAHASSADTICLKNGCNGLSRKPWHRPALPIRSRFTPCAIPLPPNCCRPPPTSARCRSCWGTPM